MVNRRSHPSQGFSTTSSASRARSDRRARAASFSVRLMRKSRCALSLSRGWRRLAADACRGPLALPLGPRPQQRPLGLVLRVRLLRVSALGCPLRLVAGPTAPVDASRVRVLVELEHVGDDAVEKGAVVRDQDETSTAASHHVLEARQPVEIEVVRRLVEQGDVEARQEDRGQGDPRPLAPGQGRGGRVDDTVNEANLLERRREASFEIAGGQRLVPGQSIRIAVVHPGSLRAQDRSRRRQLVLGVGKSGTTQQSVAYRLAGYGVVLLRQIAHGRRGWVDHDATRCGRDQSGEDLEQRGFADAVRFDEAETGVRADRERDVVEDDAARSFVTDAAGIESGHGSGGDRTGGHAELRDRNGRDGRCADTSWPAHLRRNNVLPYLTHSWYRARERSGTSWEPTDLCPSPLRE